MTTLYDEIAGIPPHQIAGNPHLHLPYQAVTDKVAAFLFPDQPLNDIGAAQYRQILERAEQICRQLGYSQLVKLTPPAVPLAEAGLYWQNQSPSPTPADRLSQLGLDELESSLNSQKQKYNSTDANYTKIVNSLVEMTIPYSIRESERGVRCIQAAAHGRRIRGDGCGIAYCRIYRRGTRGHGPGRIHFR